MLHMVFLKTRLVLLKVTLFWCWVSALGSVTALGHCFVLAVGSLMVSYLVCFGSSELCSQFHQPKLTLLHQGVV